MKINQVHILRISDLKRFFDLGQLWNARYEFIKWVDRIGCEIFFDSRKEVQLYPLLKLWLTGDQRKYLGDVTDDNLLVTSTYGEGVSFPLGRLKAEVERIKAAHPQGLSKADRRNLVGLTLLYVMLGADHDDNIPLEYDFFPSILSHKCVEGFVYATADMALDPAPSGNYCGPLERRVIANMADYPIEVRSGSQAVRLTTGDCVVALFIRGQESCFSLLPNVVDDSDHRTYLSLKLNRSTRKPWLRMERPGRDERIENVGFMAIEVGGHPVYLTMDGELHDVDGACFQLSKKYELLRSHSLNGATLYAFRVDYDTYRFYTSKGIIPC